MVETLKHLFIFHYKQQSQVFVNNIYMQRYKFKNFGSGLTREGYLIDSLVVTTTCTLGALSPANKELEQVISIPIL